MRVRVGTSGYAYKEWKGSFYPEDLPADAMLRYYAGQFPTVEINNTFYRMPSESLLDRWANEVPADFTFVLKTPQRITHQKRLKDAVEDMQYLLRIASGLGPRLGPLLVQLPPNMRKDAERLRGFLSGLPRPFRAAFEFRHPSWFDDEVYALLGEAGAALCVADTDETGETPMQPTASWGYLRLRRVAYDAEAIRQWAARVKAQPWDDAFVFFKHEDAGTGPRLAASMIEALAA